jgi:hypothetical protein
VAANTLDRVRRSRLEVVQVQVQVGVRVGVERAGLAALHQRQRRRFATLELDADAGSARPVDEIAQQPGAGQVQLCLPGDDIDRTHTGHVHCSQLDVDVGELQRAPLAAERELQLVRYATRREVHAQFRFRWGSGQGLMRAVAQWCLGGVLAGTEIDPAAALGNVGQRREVAALMGTAAERLRARQPAAAPVIGLACLDVHGDRRPCGHGGLCHHSSGKVTNNVAGDASSLGSQASALGLRVFEAVT